MSDYDPLSDPEEVRSVTSTLSAFLTYRRAAHSNITHRRRTSFYSLPRSHQEILKNPAIDYLGTLSRIDQAIEKNALFAEAICRNTAGDFGVDLNAGEGGCNKKWVDSASAEDVDKVRSTLRQFCRDWSVEGRREREVCYGPVLEELEERFGSLGGDRWKIRVLVPGCGLGRLPFEICLAGYTCQGNEFSYHQLMASNFVLNHTKSANQYEIHPFISTFSNHLTRQDQLRSIKIPDVHPATLLDIPSPTTPQQPPIPDDTTMSDGNNTSNPTSNPPPPNLPSDRFSMIAGDFLDCYNQPAYHSAYHVCTTVFFIDTAPNLISYLKTIHNLLVPGGVWINFGPLLWHYEDHPAPKRDVIGDGAFELSLDEVLEIVMIEGFVIEKRRSGVRTGYTGDWKSMLRHEYEAEFWVAVKV